ncbi:MAG TPA: hypothetical protein VM925_37370 [Labilithrix sp.]|nr:hypothetical protein [Labilithrix sp.]
MAGMAPVELSTNCNHCGLEGGVVEVYDALVAACRFGLPATTRCKLCNAASVAAFDRPLAKPLREVPANRCPACLHELAPSAIDERRCSTCKARASLLATNAPASFATLADLEAALDSWAEREKFPSREALAVATFADPDLGRIFAAIEEKAPIEILADPFANMGVRTTGGGARHRSESRHRPPASDSPPFVAADRTEIRPPIELATPPNEPTREEAHAIAFAKAEPLAGPVSPPPPSAPPRAIVYPLVSVVTADGEIHPEERALIDRFLQSEGLAPLAEHELRVHHPSEVAHLVPKERREDVVKLMCESAAIDGMPDESERRVIRAYATAWDVDDEKIDFWMWGYESMNTSLARQLFLKLRRFVLSARWSAAESKEP